MTETYRKIADRVEQAVDELTICGICQSVPGSKKRRAYPGSDRCWPHMTRSMRAVSKRQDNLNYKLGSKYGFYIRHVSDAIQLIRAEAEMAGERGRLYTTDLSEEVALGRLLLIDWLNKHQKDPDLPLKDLLECLSIIGKLSITARKIAEMDDAGLKEEQLRAIVTAISHAFHKANLAPAPEVRAAIFAAECTSIFGGGTQRVDTPALPATVEGDFARMD